MRTDQARLEIENKLLRELLEEAHASVRLDANTGDTEAAALNLRLSALFDDGKDVLDVMQDHELVQGEPPRDDAARWRLVVQYAAEEGVTIREPEDLLQLRELTAEDAERMPGEPTDMRDEQLWALAQRMTMAGTPHMAWGRKLQNILRGPAVGDLASAIGLDLNDPKVLAEVQAIAGGPKKPEFVPTTDMQGLAYLVEECGEVLIPLQTVIGRVLQQVGKVIRFGWQNRHHLRPDVTNAMQLAKELADLRAAVDLLRNKLWPPATHDSNEPQPSGQCEEEAGHGAHRCLLPKHGPEIDHVWFEEDK